MVQGIKLKFLGHVKGYFELGKMHNLNIGIPTVTGSTAHTTTITTTTTATITTTTDTSTNEAKRITVKLSRNVEKDSELKHAMWRQV